MQLNRPPNYQLAENEAHRVLREHYVQGPPVPVYEIARELGLDIVEADFPPKFSDVSGYIDIDNNRIVVNRADSPARKAFTVAHEIGHVELHKDLLEQHPELSVFYRRPIGRADTNPIETEANTFAANLLVPIQYLNDYLSDSPDLIAKLFGVSRQVIGYRLDQYQRRAAGG